MTREEARYYLQSSGFSEEQMNTIEQAFKKEPKWIPVSERLPKENEEVLVTTVWGEVTIGERYSTIDYFINDGAINANEDEIIAWMPLPKSYDPQKSEGK